MALIARWEFENNANDTQGSYNGTATSVTYATDDPKSGSYYARFSGSPSKIEAAGPNLFANTAFTVSCWHRLYTSTLNGDVMSAGNGTTLSYWQWFTYVYNGHYRMYIGKFINLDTGSIIVSGLQGRWVFLTAVDNNGSLDLYVNGNYWASKTYTRDSATISEISLGANTTTSYSYYGYVDLDDIRIYDTGLTATEIKALYNSYFPLLAQWKLDGNANDTLGNYNLTATNITWAKNLKPTGSYSAYFANGASPKIEGNISNVTGLTNFSLSTWVYFESTKGGDIVAFGDGANHYPYQLFYYYENTYTPKHRLHFGVLNNILTDTVIDFQKYTGKWTHVVITDANGVELVYLDGKYAGTRTYTRSAYASSKISLGSNTVGYTPYYGQGYRSDFRIYDIILTASEVSQLYNSYFTEKVGPMFLT